jgi:hypothetical protein
MQGPELRGSISAEPSEIYFTCGAQGHDIFGVLKFFPVSQKFRFRLWL